MKIGRVVLVLAAFLPLAACESPADPKPEITGEPCTARAADCFLVTGLVVPPVGSGLRSNVAADTVFYCPVAFGTFDHVTFGDYWRCDWRRITPSVAP